MFGVSTLSFFKKINNIFFSQVAQINANQFYSSKNPKIKFPQKTFLNIDKKFSLSSKSAY